MSSTSHATELTSLLPTTVIQDECELVDKNENLFRKRQTNKRFAMILAGVAITTTALLVMLGSQKNGDTNSRFFAELLTMAPPGAVSPTSWTDCKETAHTIATECYNLNPVPDAVKECKARGKEAAKACYKNVGKEYKKYYKNIGKQYKGYYHHDKSKPAGQDGESSSTGSSILAIEGSSKKMAAGPTIDWAECSGKMDQVMNECLELNPDDKKGCKKQAKAATQDCYIAIVEAYKEYYEPKKKNKGG